MLILCHAPWALTDCGEIAGVRRDVPDGPARDDPACDDLACEFLVSEFVEREVEELAPAMSHSGISR